MIDMNGRQMAYALEDGHGATEGKRMKWIREILRGMIIGVAGILPGVSGGAMLVAMGVYDAVIGAVNALLSDFRHSVQLLWPYALGMLLGVLTLARLIALLMERFPLPACMAFIGLILGGTPALMRRVRRVRRGKPGWIAFLATFVISLALPLWNPDGSANVTLGFGVDQVLALLGAGVLASATMVIPGVSGSMLLMMLGYYDPIVRSIGHAVDALMARNMAVLFGYGWLLLPFALGVVGGTLILARVVELLLKRYEGPCCCAMLGLVAASPVVILLGLDLSQATALTRLVGAETGILGFAAAYELSGDKSVAGNVQF